MVTVIRVNTTPSYDIQIKPGLLSCEQFAQICLAHLKQFKQKNIVIITDDHVQSLYAEAVQANLAAAGARVLVLSVGLGEACKTREVKAKLEDQMLAQGLTRDVLIIACGGGVVTDMAGFLAATYCRGVPVIYVPTSLLAMVDASIGGKTAVNTAFGKNMIGTITQPATVLIDPNVLTTLSLRERKAGLIELLKHGLICDKNLFSQIAQQFKQLLSLETEHERALLTNLIIRSLQIKEQVVRQDSQEKGLRQVLNLGHTMAHALELVTDYQLNHGEAVAHGLLIEAAYAVEIGVLLQTDYQALQDLLIQADLLVPLKSFGINWQAVIDALMLDKKALNQTPYFVLLASIGRVYTQKKACGIVCYSHQVDLAVLRQLLQVF